MISQRWEALRTKVDEMSIRERAMVFAAAAFLLITLVNVLLLDPLMAKQKNTYKQLVQQQEKIKEVQAQIDEIWLSKNSQDKLPQRLELNRLKQELAEGDAFLQSNREKLVQPEKMAELLRQVLSKNANLQLITLQTLPVTSLFEKDTEQKDVTAATLQAESQKGLIFKHGVKITVKGGYLELLQYLTALERLPTQMFWGNVKMEVVHYPAAELTLILYTLSLDKVWLQI